MSATTFDNLNQPFEDADKLAESLAREATMRMRATKTMMWLAIVSMIMLFAGLTSAYIVSMGDGDWLYFDLPPAFFVSTALIIISSGTLTWAYYAARKDNYTAVTIGLVLTLLLGIGFVIGQFVGYAQLREANIWFTGVNAEGIAANRSGSYLYLITLVHLAHLAAGLIVIIWTAVQAIRKKYDSKHLHGLQLTSIFWHFLGVLWVYLLLFFLFIR